MKKPKRYDRVKLYEKNRQRTFEADVIKVGYKNFQVIDDSGTSNCIDMRMIICWKITLYKC